MAIAAHYESIATIRGMLSDEKDYHLHQSVNEVMEFSSQYGSDTSFSYTARNIIGEPTIYPRVGDHAHSFHLRTYGPWWEALPSNIKRPPILPPDSLPESQDFLEIRYRYPVKPISMVVYETYNPGAILKVLGFQYETQRWVLLWEEAPQVLDYFKSRLFTIELDEVNFMTDYYRLEFYHKHLKYYCELDAICLGGNDKVSNKEIKRPKPNLFSQKLTSIKNLFSTTCHFETLPSEVMLYILSFLDLRSLCAASRVSRLFQKVCYDPVLYKDLNLKPYWNLVNALTLKHLESRLPSLKHLNLSWCGGQQRIPPSSFNEFIETNCHLLTSLRLANCIFINNSTLKTIGTSCPLLQELELKSCRNKNLTHTGFICIAQLTELTYLDLYRTEIDMYSMIAIIKSCTKLEHLFLGACSAVINFNEVAKAIARNLKDIKTLDFWRGATLGCPAILELAENCKGLVELDLGWCAAIDASCGCIRQLVTNCNKLKKLFLSATRTITNNDLNAITSCCKDLEQLDVLGSREITVDAIENVLFCCKKLKLLDISFCDRSVYKSATTLQEHFPSVEIKCSAPPAEGFLSASDSYYR